MDTIAAAAGHLSCRSDFIEEYKLLTQRWDNYGFQALVVKGWVTAAMLAGVIAYQSVKEHRRASVAFLGLILALTIWLFEAVWKSWQVANYTRIMALEAYFRGDDTTPLQPFQIYSSWLKDYGSGAGWVHIAEQLFRLYVMLPYVVFIPICLLSIGRLYLWPATKAGGDESEAKRAHDGV